MQPSRKPTPNAGYGPSEEVSNEIQWLGCGSKAIAASTKTHGRFFLMLYQCCGSRIEVFIGFRGLRVYFACKGCYLGNAVLDLIFPCGPIRTIFQNPFWQDENHINTINIVNIHKITMLTEKHVWKTAFLFNQKAFPISHVSHF